MILKYITIFITVIMLLSSLSHAAVRNRNKKSFKNKKDKKTNVIRSEAGLNIPEWGVAIDATFNPELDKIIPGYHIVNIVLTNRRGKAIMLSTAEDKWIFVDSMGKKHTAYNHIKQFNKALWPKLPLRLQKLLDYPHLVNPGKSTTIDVFLPDNVDLFNFREIIWKSAHFRKEFSIFTNYEKNLSINSNEKEFTTPKTNHITEEEILNLEKDKETENDVEIITPTTNDPKIDTITKTGKIPDPTLEGFIRIK